MSTTLAAHKLPDILISPTSETPKENDVRRRDASRIIQRFPILFRTYRRCDLDVTAARKKRRNLT